MEVNIPEFRRELAEEVKHLLAWWIKYSPDTIHGGFHGEINNQNEANPHAPKGLVLNSRILWAFSAAYAHDPQPEYLSLAERAYACLRDNFYDTQAGGFYWSLQANGEILESKKQVYGQAFAIYGLSAYYQIQPDAAVLDLAINTYQLLEKHSRDTQLGGYLEAFNQHWEALEDLRLSDKDMNAEKTMNTHLHVVEAYAELYKIWPNADLKAAISHLLELFKTKFISTQGYQHLFFDKQWQLQSQTISFGHDIESAWLLLACAHAIADPKLIQQFEGIALSLAESATKGLSESGNLYNEYHIATHSLNAELHWWVQAEAMVGLYQAYQLSANPAEFKKTYQLWQNLNQHFFDQKYGEWIWGLDAEGNPLNEPKAGFWKCPYHHVRACLELLKRLPDA
ncbi:MAG: N-acyl-D-glucosamine 2-epimerase [Pedobacter sp.]|nr:MAG: N-acyl-D-glucosamine 2-epimerase [Pedobacter sp.]